MVGGECGFESRPGRCKGRDLENDGFDRETFALGDLELETPFCQMKARTVSNQMYVRRGRADEAVDG